MKKSKETDSERTAAYGNGAGRSGVRLRLVRVPGGFAYIADGSATSEA
jgi:hypothetical protein